MLPPYHCLHRCSRVLLAASSSRLDLFNIEDGTQLSSWTTHDLLKDDFSSNLVLTEGNDFEPPAKKRRLSGVHDTGAKIVAQIAAQNDKQHVAVPDKQEVSSVTALASTKSGDHVIILTGEDKSIRVFRLDCGGNLQCISQRVMPKRPCAIALTHDETAIICGDKFGDVYSIPLFSRPLVDSQHQGTFIGAKSWDRTPSKPLVPAANDLTVHSVRNRKALQNQIKYKNNAPQKPEPQFERRLLLGHVSMLTDIALGQRNGMNYIITADRDEHIRVSRGTPQAHIIEGYCLGHKEFVSRLCFPSERPDILISGGGDDEIYIWDWRIGKVVHKLNLKCHVENIAADIKQNSITVDKVNETDNPPSGALRIAVSNIEYMSRTLRQQDDLIMVTCEGVPAIFIFSFQENSAISHDQTLKLDGNPLSLVVDSKSNFFVVSIDGAHKAGSTTQLRKDQNIIVDPLQYFHEAASGWRKQPLHFKVDLDVATHLNVDVYEAKRPADLLYPAQRLRKTGGED